MDRFPGFEILDHTADVRVRLTGETAHELVRNAVRAVAFLFTGQVDRPLEPPVSELDLAGRADDLEETLVDVMNELIFLHETRGLVCSEVADVRLELPEYRVRVRGSAARRGDPLAPVKAATYGGLEVVGTEKGGWSASVILDV